MPASVLDRPFHRSGWGQVVWGSVTEQRMESEATDLPGRSLWVYPVGPKAVCDLSILTVLCLPLANSGSGQSKLV